MSENRTSAIIIGIPDPNRIDSPGTEAAACGKSGKEMLEQMAYRLIALDLDGTLLNSRKEIETETLQAVREACAAGAIVVFNTGRAVPELEEEIRLLPEVRYAVFASGAGIYDIRKRKFLGLQAIPRDHADQILAVAKTRDLMPQIVLPEQDVIQQSHLDELERFHMGVYRPMYEQAMTCVPEIYGFADSCREPILKINLYHADPPERVCTREQLADVPVEKVYAEVSSLECSARGVNKGQGLEQLCSLLRIPLSECVAVGDAENDLVMIRAAGLGVAMGNATPQVRAAADRIVPDCDHGGCAEAIRLALER